LARLDELRRGGDGLTAAEADELQKHLVRVPEPPGPIDERALATLDSAARRAAVDELQPGNATVWEDPHFF
jgi:hypothetical protein